MSKMGTPRSGSPGGTQGTTHSGVTPRTPGTTRSGAQSARYMHSHPTTWQAKKVCSQCLGTRVCTCACSRSLAFRKQNAYFRGTRWRWSSSASSAYQIKNFKKMQFAYLPFACRQNLKMTEMPEWVSRPTHIYN